MSDALQHPPSFDEMVGLIEKLFKDYLEDVLKSNPEEIEKSWIRYKTLNHLWQDDQPQPGAGWVKASEFKKQQNIHYCGRTKTPQGVIYATIYWNHKWERFVNFSIEGRVEFEILDESGAAPSGERESDALMFAEWCAVNYQRDFEPLDASLPINERKYRQFWIDNNQREFRTTQLYDIFKQQNRNNENS